MSNLKVTVVGAGVVGLSTACAFQRAFPNADLTVVAADIDSGIVSYVAAGYLSPTVAKMPTSDLAVLGKWTAASSEHYRAIATSADSDAAGVGISPLCELSDKPNAEEPFFAPYVFSCRRLTDDQLDYLLPNARSAGIATGFQAVTVYAQGSRYLPYLMHNLRSGGRVSVRREKLNSLAEAADGGCHLLFNCTGLGASKLCSDPDVYPSRGQVVRVHAPMQKLALHGPGAFYVLPNRDDVVIGGTAGAGSFDLNVSETDTEDIMTRAYRILPALRTARILGAHVGLRPYRRGGSRLEVDRGLLDGLPVVHNYCHGANGVGLSWGSAVHAVELATEALRSGRPRM
uniref:DAO domain-containing protein n=1 Tax=Macrostomum lignano TaxID=282301 RepID=A0A1I8JG82_9PLAT